MNQKMMTGWIAALVVLTQFPAASAAAETFGEMTTLDSFGGPSSGTYKPTESEKARIEWWRDAKFGLFMHWGLYSKMAG